MDMVCGGIGRAVDGKEVVNGLRTVGWWLVHCCGQFG